MKHNSTELNSTIKTHQLTSNFIFRLRTMPLQANALKVKQGSTKYMNDMKQLLFFNDQNTCFLYEMFNLELGDYLELGAETGCIRHLTVFRPLKNNCYEFTIISSYKLMMY